MATSPGTEERRPYRLPAAVRREQLLDAAAGILVDRGIDGVSMESIAAAAGVSKGLGYSYFTNRDDVLLALLDRELGELERRVFAALSVAGDFEARIRAALTAWLDVVEERGSLLGTLLQVGQIQGPLQERHSTIYRGLEELYGAMAVEAFGIDRRRAVAAAAVLLAGLAGLIERWVETGDDRELLEETFMSLTLGGIQRIAEEEAGRAG